MIRLKEKSMQNLILDLINASEITAIATSKFIGKNDPEAADNAAVINMRNALNKIHFKAKIIIGEGERDKAPMLHIGELVGSSDCEVQYDIAIDPLECTTRCAKGDGPSMTAILIAKAGMLLQAPDVYMNKIIAMTNNINLDSTIEENLLAVSQAKGVAISDLTVSILDRDRHTDIINRVLASGAKVKLIADGDITAAIMSCVPHSGVDMYIGIGGAPEGVIAAGLVSMMGGKMEGRLVFQDESQKKRARSMCNSDIDRKLTIADMTGNEGEMVCIMTGITSGELLSGVTNCTTDSIIISRDKNGTIYNRQILTNRC
jgi:fructose-1,6-bisphosphatase class II